MEKRYRDHICKVRNARCEIDARPPRLKVGTYLRVTPMRLDKECYKRIYSENVNLLEKLNKIQRNVGEVKSYNKTIGVRKTRIPDVKRWLKKIDEENLTLGKKLLSMKPTMRTRLSPVPWKPNFTEKYRRELYQQYRDVMPVRDLNTITLLLWPKIYIDLEIKDVRPLDRVVIVLCTEAAPNVVLQMIRLCKEKKSLFKFNRIYPNLWIEGEIEKPVNAVLGFTQKVNPHIDHGQTGTLTLLERDPKGNFEFSISFKPLKVMNGKKVAFGKVLEGLKVLDAIQAYGTKNGKPKKEIFVKACGLIK